MVILPAGSSKSTVVKIENASISSTCMMGESLQSEVHWCRRKSPMLSAVLSVRKNQQTVDSVHRQPNQIDLSTSPNPPAFSVHFYNQKLNFRIIQTHRLGHTRFLHTYDFPLQRKRPLPPLEWWQQYPWGSKCRSH